MLSIFPELLPFALFTPTIIRVVIGFVLVYLGVLTLFKKRKIFTQKLISFKYPFPFVMVWFIGVLEICIGCLLIIGLLMQAIVMVAAYLFINIGIIDSKGRVSNLDDDKIFGFSWLLYVVLIIISISLIFSGAGFLAIDLPI